METFVYLHGFASSPRSAKATVLADRFGSIGVPLVIPDLNQPDFAHLTLTRQIQQVAALLSAVSGSVTLIGSSFGGLTAAWVGDRQPQVTRLVLLAPAFQFLAHWLPQLGDQVQRWQASQWLSIYHYGEQQLLPLHYRFVTDAQGYDEAQLQRPVPTLMLHGRTDEVIPIQASRKYAIDRPWVRLIELDSDHSLSSGLDAIWQAIHEFCQFA
jgi:hypothetical protein